MSVDTQKSALKIATQHASARSTALAVGSLPDGSTPAAAAVSTERIATPYVRFAKPTLDRTVATLMLVPVTPVLAVVAFAIRRSMGKGVIFKQDRVGRSGETFTLYKFRTMSHDRRLEPHDAAFTGADRRVSHKRDDDPRHTPVGRFLRKWSLDELPQIWNVARGHMSFVGPRPELVSIVEAKYMPFQHRRHAVKPGITGLWQVSERKNGLMYENPEPDLAYVDSVSLVQDAKIVIRTFRVLAGGSGN